MHSQTSSQQPLSKPHLHYRSHHPRLRQPGSQGRIVPLGTRGPHPAVAEQHHGGTFPGGSDGGGHWLLLLWLRCRRRGRQCVLPLLLLLLLLQLQAVAELNIGGQVDV